MQRMDRWIGKICPNTFKLLEKSKYDATVCIVNGLECLSLKLNARMETNS